MSNEEKNQLILTRTEGAVGIVQLNRPKVLNALNAKIMDQLMSALEAFDADDEVGCMVVTGNERAFAAGADINHFADQIRIYTLYKIIKIEIEVINSVI